MQRQPEIITPRPPFVEDEQEWSEVFGQDQLYEHHLTRFFRWVSSYWLEILFIVVVTIPAIVTRLYLN